jgi:hypothetical protein
MPQHKGGGGGRLLAVQKSNLERVNLSVNNIKDMCEHPDLPYNLWLLLFFFLITDFIALIAVNNLLDIQLFSIQSFV